MLNNISEKVSEMHIFFGISADGSGKKWTGEIWVVVDNNLLAFPDHQSTMVGRCTGAGESPHLIFDADMSKENLDCISGE